MFSNEELESTYGLNYSEFMDNNKVIFEKMKTVEFESYLNGEMVYFKKTYIGQYDYALFMVIDVNDYDEESVLEQSENLYELCFKRAYLEQDGTIISEIDL